MRKTISVAVGLQEWRSRKANWWMATSHRCSSALLNISAASWSRLTDCYKGEAELSLNEKFELYNTMYEHALKVNSPRVEIPNAEDSMALRIARIINANKTCQ